MAVPLLGPMTLSGFAHEWYLLFLLVVLGLVGLYIIVQLARQKRLLRFANMELLESVAPKRPTRWRHLPAILLVLSLLLLTVAMAGPDPRRSDPAQPRGGDAGDRCLTVHAGHRRAAQPAGRRTGRRQAVRRRADAGYQPGTDRLRGHRDRAGVADDQPRRHQAAIDKLQLADRTATGEGIFTALQAIATVGAVIGGGDAPPPARIVLLSDGKETVPSNPDNPKGAFTAARTAKDQGVPISTISFGTPYGYVEINGQRQPVPVDDETLKKIAELSGGQAFNASSLVELKNVYATLQQQIGYETIRGDASAGWLRLGALVLAASALAAMLINRRLPT